MISALNFDKEKFNVQLCNIITTIHILLNLFFCQLNLENFIIFLSMGFFFDNFNSFSFSEGSVKNLYAIIIAPQINALFGIFNCIFNEGKTLRKIPKLSNSPVIFVAQK